MKSRLVSYDDSWRQAVKCNRFVQSMAEADPERLFPVHDSLQVLCHGVQ